MHKCEEKGESMRLGKRVCDVSDICYRWGMKDNAKKN